MKILKIASVALGISAVLFALGLAWAMLREMIPLDPITGMCAYLMFLVGGLAITIATRRT